MSDFISLFCGSRKPDLQGSRTNVSSCPLETWSALRLDKDLGPSGVTPTQRDAAASSSLPTVPPACSPQPPALGPRVPPPAPLSGSAPVRAGPPPPLLPPSSSPVSSSSAFCRSLAASCISQSISQSMARQTQDVSSYLRTRSSSPKGKCPQQASSPAPLLRSATLSHQRSSSPSPRPSALHSRSSSMQNVNNNNNLVTSVASPSANSQASMSVVAGDGGRVAPLTNGIHDPLCSPSHNRVAQPFPASEPCSRVQSPCSPTGSFSRRCSPLPQSHAATTATKPPAPWTGRGAGAASWNPLEPTLELARSSSAGSGCVSPRILSPPPIGVSAASWANNVAAPQPRNARCASSSPSPSFSSPLFSLTPDNGPSLPPAYVAFPPRRSGASSPALSWSCPHRRSSSCGPAEAPPSWGEGRGPLGAPKEPEVQELFSKRGGTVDPDGLFTSSSSSPLASWGQATPPPGPAAWRDPDPEEGTCRSQLICAYIGRPLPHQSVSPPLFPFHPQAQVQIDLTAAPSPSAPPPSPPLSSGQSSPSRQRNQRNQRNQRSSYATTVNLQIGGSGRIKSFSTAQVSLTQTLQGGASGGGAGQTLRRVSVNGLSHLPSSLSHH